MSQPDPYPPIDTPPAPLPDPEPLPQDHPLWSCPGVLVSPHVGGNTTAFIPRARRLVQDQIGRYVAGEPLTNVITADY